MKVKQLAIALCAVAALLVGSSVSAETIDYIVSGWQVTCSNVKFTGVEGTCLVGTADIGSLSNGTITGTAQFVGDSISGGILTVTNEIYVTSSTPGVGPATITVTGSWFGLDSSFAVVTGGLQSLDCSPSSDVICKTPNTPLPISSITIYPPGATIGGTLSFIINALASGGANQAWQSYTLTVPEPSTVLLWGAALLTLIAIVTRRED